MGRNVQLYASTLLTPIRLLASIPPLSGTPENLDGFIRFHEPLESVGVERLTRKQGQNVCLYTSTQIARKRLERFGRSAKIESIRAVRRTAGAFRARISGCGD